MLLLASLIGIDLAAGAYQALDAAGRQHRNAQSNALAAQAQAQAEPQTQYDLRATQKLYANQLALMAAAEAAHNTALGYQVSALYGVQTLRPIHVSKLVSNDSPAGAMIAARNWAAAVEPTEHEREMAEIEANLERLKAETEGMIRAGAEKRFGLVRANPMA